MQQYFDKILSKYHNFQYCSTTMIEKWRESVDKGSSFGGLYQKHLTFFQMRF